MEPDMELLSPVVAVFDQMQIQGDSPDETS